MGHITPESYKGGLIGLVEDEDRILIDAVNNIISLQVREEIIAERRAKYTQPELKVTKGVLFKYAKTVSDAASGCVTDEY